MREVNDQKKMWESAYAVMNHPRIGPYMHGAGMAERTTGVQHYWLVRGPCTQSVVQELQRQITHAYKLEAAASASKAAKPIGPAAGRITHARPIARASAMVSTGEHRRLDRCVAGIVLAGLIGFAIGYLARD
jgi:hypothetical protein